MITSHVLLSPLELKKFSQTKAWGKLVTADSVTFLLVVPLLGVFFLFPLFFFVYTQRIRVRTVPPARLTVFPFYHFSTFCFGSREASEQLGTQWITVRTYVCMRTCVGGNLNTPETGKKNMGGWRHTPKRVRSAAPSDTWI